MSNKKIRLVGGPAGGKVMDATDLYGRNEIIIISPKKMSRKQRWEWENEQYEKNRNVLYGQMIPYPRVEARYRISSYPGLSYAGNPTTMPAMHPDGSIFYEYVEGSKREFS